MNILKHHINKLANMASTNALASEFIEGMPKSVAICNIAVGVASTTMSEEQMQALNNELEPVLQRATDELKAVANKHGVSFSGHGAALIGKRPSRAKKIRPVLSVICSPLSHSKCWSPKSRLPVQGRTRSRHSPRTA